MDSAGRTPIIDADAENRVWDLIDVIDYTAVFRRTGEALLGQFGDGWRPQRCHGLRLFSGRSTWQHNGGQRDLKGQLSRLPAANTALARKPAMAASDFRTT